MRALKIGTASALCLFVTFIGAGCNVAGPASIRAGRANYNIAIQQTNNEQHLLNIVRLKYRDTPYHLEVSSVASQLFLEASGAATASLPEASLNTFGLVAGLKYTERPTVSYTPLHGEKFVKQMLTPVDLDVLLLLYHSGWSVERIMRVCLQSMGDVPNAPSASGPTPSDAPQFREFREMTGALRALQKEGLMKFGRAEEPDRLRVVIDPVAADRSDVARLRSLLGLAGSRNSFDLTTSIAAPQSGQVAVSTRSIIAMFFYLSQGVEVSSDDEVRGLVTVTRRPDGSSFDWDELNGDLFNVRCSDTRSPGASVAVPYRGKWFSIDDDDLDSKSTFSMLTQLFALQAGDVQSTAPILTLPLGN